VFKSAEEREAERRARAAEETREAAAGAERARVAEEQRQRAAFLATPLGAATAAKEAGLPFFEIQLEVGAHSGSASFGSIDGRRTASSSAATLGEIKKLGWRLEHAGYYFMITGETSTARVFMSGEATAVSGVTVGVYLFRNCSFPPEDARRTQPHAGDKAFRIALAVRCSGQPYGQRPARLAAWSIPGLFLVPG
jgi:hypothetical protein